MKVMESELFLTSNSQLTQKKEKTENLEIWVGKPSEQNPSNEIQDILELSKNVRKELLCCPVQAAKTSGELELELKEEDQVKIKLIEKFIETLTGKKIKLHVPKIKIQHPEANITSLKNTQIVSDRQGWGLIYDLVETYQEKESMSFAASGLVKTADGREIHIDLNVNFNREFYLKNELHLRMGDAAKIDPLVITYSQALPSLTDEKYTFDLDADGTPDQISFLNEGSGFLALDLDGDGTINNGRELFGPETGDGFNELSRYDQDQNSWIDENDPIFDKLRIWVKDSEGKDQLLALGQVGIGAIYLGHVNSLFHLKTTDNQLQGEIAKTGIFLRENNSAGLIQHINLTI